MKCVRRRAKHLEDDVQRLPDVEAKALVEGGSWKYTTKGVWKSAGRPGKIRK